MPLPNMELENQIKDTGNNNASSRLGAEAVSSMESLKLNDIKLPKQIPGFPDVVLEDKLTKSKDREPPKTERETNEAPAQRNQRIGAKEADSVHPSISGHDQQGRTTMLTFDKKDGTKQSFDISYNNNGQIDSIVRHDGDNHTRFQRVGDQFQSAPSDANGVPRQPYGAAFTMPNVGANSSGFVGSKETLRQLNVNPRD